jgi:hypothetical protein
MAAAAMILLYRARQRFDAYLLAGRLREAGIRAHVFNEHAASIVGDVPPDIAQPQVWLDNDADEPRARALLAEIESDARREGSVFCRHCREESPANFDLCWACGASLS